MRHACFKEWLGGEEGGGGGSFDCDSFRFLWRDRLSVFLFQIFLGGLREGGGGGVSVVVFFPLR